jgi:hypothetical protein
VHDGDGRRTTAGGAAPSDRFSRIARTGTAAYGRLGALSARLLCLPAPSSRRSPLGNTTAQGAVPTHIMASFVLVYRSQEGVSAMRAAPITGRTGACNSAADPPLFAYPWRGARGLPSQSRAEAGQLGHIRPILGAGRPRGPRVGRDIRTIHGGESLSVRGSED